VPLTREAIEVALDLLAQFAGPPGGIESGRSPRGHAHRVVGATGTGRPMTFDCDWRQVLNSHVLTATSLSLVESRRRLPW